MLVVFAAAAVLWRLRGGRDFVPGPEAFGARDDRRMAFYGLAPAILGLHAAVPQHRGDWYFSGKYPTPGGYRVVNQAFVNYYEKQDGRAY